MDSRLAASRRPGMTERTDFNVMAITIGGKERCKIARRIAAILHWPRFAYRARAFSHMGLSVPALGIVPGEPEDQCRDQKNSASTATRAASSAPCADDCHRSVARRRDGQAWP